MKTIEEVELLETIETVIDYKEREANRELNDARHNRDNAKLQKDKDFWDRAYSRTLSKWSAYHDMLETIALYK